MNRKIVLVSKDAMCKSYLPIYGNRIWSTPNIDTLSKLGTVFHRHYTAAPSTSMAFISMFTGLYPYQTKYKLYNPMGITDYPNLFEQLNISGYTCHVIWGKDWLQGDTAMTEGYGEKTIFHLVDHFEQAVGAHFPHRETLIHDINKTEKVTVDLKRILDEVCCKDEKTFLWVHFPHVIYGHTSYGDDIETFDNCIGIIRDYFPDEGIYVTADHGNMNGQKGKFCYGFDCYESAICIPLITPRINDKPECHDLTSNIDLISLILNYEIPNHEYVVADCAYYAQPQRNIALISDRYKYIYFKRHSKEELYDILYDPFEQCNIIQERHFDSDRIVLHPLKDIYYYPYWEEALTWRTKLRNERAMLWRRGSACEELFGNCKYYLKKARSYYYVVRNMFEQ
ncbi:hypothetical protein AGMMS49992_27970 [Clostridia bacterium]|nr:hypothetical protein AGMMS49992_27970 [Clostridia bacterium]